MSGPSNKCPLRLNLVVCTSLQNPKSARPTLACPNHCPACPLSTAGWAADVAVEAYVVNLRHAAAPDCDGLLQPLLKRWQTGRCSYKVFGLPAVQVRPALCEQPEGPRF